MSKELTGRYEKFFGKGTFEKLLNERKKHSEDQFIRVNLSKNTLNDIEIFLKQNRVKFSKTFFQNALKIEKSFFNLSSSPESILGKIYLQDLASQIPVNCINFNSFRGKKIKILDMAASPGSKTTQMADMLKFHKIKYEIIALEPEQKRLTRLINNIQKQGFENISIFNIKGEEFISKEKFDIILLDAPCSGNLVGDKNWLNKRDVKGILEKANIQKKLLKKAESLLAPKGILIYSTCSLEIEENELNVSWILKNSKLKSFRPALNFAFETNSNKIIKDKSLLFKLKSVNSLRFMPYISGTQGFFVCCFRK